MNKKGRKKQQKQYAQNALTFYFNKLEEDFSSIPTQYQQLYVKEIVKLQTSFNIKLKREEKLKICKQCYTFQNSTTQCIRLNPKLKTKEYICKNCGSVRRFKYK